MTHEKPNEAISRPATLEIHGLIFDTARELRCYEEGMHAAEPSDTRKGERPSKAAMIAAAIRGLRK